MPGLHWIIELSGCDMQQLASVDSVEAVLLGAARRAQMTIVNTLFHQFTPHGVSGFVVVAESHLAIHTWPEQGYAAVDIFTCGHADKMQVAYDHLVEAFRPTTQSRRELVRTPPG